MSHFQESVSLQFMAVQVFISKHGPIVSFDTLFSALYSYQVLFSEGELQTLLDHLVLRKQVKSIRPCSWALDINSMFYQNE